MAEPFVRAAGLERTYRIGQTEAHAVREATFEIHDGARIALVGPSGSGKTTILHLIAALDEPTGQQDGDTGRAMMTELLDAAAEGGMALLVATHDVRVAERLEIRWSIRDGSLDAGVIPSSR